jgi:4-amino-4-deoxy-L-arabinose transferase-like glycosyltransferase
MSKKGAGYPHEILMALFILILALTFYAKDSIAIMPPILLIIGAVMTIAGFIVKEPLLTAGGLVLLAVALIYSETVH